jgi:hypothetical protein
MVREEVNGSLKSQQNILNWTSVATGVLLIFALNLWKETQILAFVFFVLIFPSAALMFLNIWLSEIARMIRASKYLLVIEETLQAYLTDKKTPLFEHWLREKDSEGNPRCFKFGYKSAIAIYLGLVVFSYIVANIIFWTYKGNLFVHNGYTYKIAFLISTIALNILIILNTYKRIQKYILH